MQVSRNKANRVLRRLGLVCSSSSDASRRGLWAGLEQLEARQLMSATGLEQLLTPTPVLTAAEQQIQVDLHSNSEDHGSGCHCGACRALYQKLEDGAILEADMLDVPDMTVAVDYGPVFASTAPAPTSSVTVASAGADATFKLHSNASAAKKIYLDFTGHTTSGTYWNSGYNGGAAFTTAAYDIDGNAGVFSVTELTRIQNIFARVAEDYSPFDVDVTTEEPPVDQLMKSGATDTQWGVRMVIGGSSSSWLKQSAGGVAYVGSFNWNTDTPAFVFTAQLGNGDEKYTAEAISHEAGHSLGLSHDGTASAGYYTGQGSGTTGWAPIMGVGYYQNLSQWSKGEYSGASNKQDDLSIITSNNGFGYRADAIGDTIAAAGKMTVNGTAITGSSIIEKAADVDVWSFTTGDGAVSITVDPAARGANLDVMAELLNSAGQILMTSNPTSLLNASIATTLSAGTYFLRISGVGSGDPLTTGYSDYASIGQYSISGTIAAPSTQNQTTNNTTTNTTTKTTAPLATFSVGNVTVNEGAGTATFTVSLSKALAASSSVQVATVEGTAKAGADFTAVNKTLTFAAGQTSQKVTVNLLNDSLVETLENFALKLSNASAGLAIAADTATASIQDNDVRVYISNATAVETDPNRRGGRQTTDMVFTVSLSAVAQQNITVTLATSNGTAVSGLDFLGGAATVSFQAGRQTSQNIIVKVIGDKLVEASETMYLNITSISGADVGSLKGAGAIIDNDGASNASVAGSSSRAEIADQDAMNQLVTDIFNYQQSTENTPVTATSGSNTSTPLNKLSRTTGAIIDILSKNAA